MSKFGGVAPEINYPLKHIPKASQNLTNRKRVFPRRLEWKQIRFSELIYTLIRPENKPGQVSKRSKYTVSDCFSSLDS